ncbi:hypothetical protein BDW22DRAFT_1039405 [Trametopsis cervina]|nr:hypothetical protein BDW22DRAFT_1039405 [Trametopsis cervina]
MMRAYSQAGLCETRCRTLRAAREFAFAQVKFTISAGAHLLSSSLLLLHARHQHLRNACGFSYQKISWLRDPGSSHLRSVDVAYDAHTQTRKHVRVVHLALAGEFLQRNVMGRWTRLRSTCMQGPRCGLLGSVCGADPSVYVIVPNVATRTPSARIVSFEWRRMNKSTEMRVRIPSSTRALTPVRPLPQVTPPIRRGRTVQAIPPRLLYDMSTPHRTRPRERDAYLGDVSLACAGAYLWMNTTRQSFLFQVVIVVIEP